MSGRGQDPRDRTIMQLQDEVIKLQTEIKGYAEREYQSRVYMAKLKNHLKKLESHSGQVVQFEENETNQ